MHEIYIQSNISLSKVLEDQRPYYFGLIFGTVEQVCKQYGIKYEKQGNKTIFHAPRNRLIYFVEKLHFSGISYKEIQ